MLLPEGLARLITLGRLIRRLLRLLKPALLAYFIYAFVFGVLIFASPAPQSSNYIENINPARFLAESEGPDRVILVEENDFARRSRFSLLAGAERTLDIAQHQINNDSTSLLFYGFLFDAADRGVHVRLLIDGFFHRFQDDHRQTLYALINHPMIDVRFYEPFTLSRPWTWNNRFHSKLLIVDSSMAVVGGRNTGDRYFSSDRADQYYVADRDVILINTEPQSSSASVLNDIGLYFDDVWNHDCVVALAGDLADWQTQQGRQRHEFLLKLVKDHVQDDVSFPQDADDWQEISMPARKISVISNPIGPFLKEPRVLAELSQIMKAAESKIVIQSPYVVKTRQMSRYFSFDKLDAAEVTILTNSIAASPNLAAISGYANKRRDIASQVDHLYEYQGNGSLHGKSYIIDDRLSIIGSFNVDARSSFLSSEIVVVIDSKPLARSIQNKIGHLTRQSLLVSEDGTYKADTRIEQRPVSWPKNIIVKFLSISLYFFDFML